MTRTLTGRPPAPFAVELGGRLRAIREQSGRSLADVESESGGKFSAASVGSYERGTRNLPVTRLSDLAAFYQVPSRDILAPAPLVTQAFTAITGAARAGVTEQVRRRLLDEAEDPRWDASLHGVLVIVAMAELIGGAM